MLPHFLTCHCTIFPAGKHSNIGSVPLKVIPSFTEISWTSVEIDGYWTPLLCEGQFSFQSSNCQNYLLVCAEGSWHLMSQWLVEDVLWNMCLWKVLFLKTAVKILTFCFSWQQSLLRVWGRKGHWDSTGRTEQTANKTEQWSVPPWLVVLLSPSPEAAIYQRDEETSWKILLALLLTCWKRCWMVLQPSF